MSTSHGTRDDTPPKRFQTDDPATLLQAKAEIRRRNNLITIRPIGRADRDNEQEFVKNLSSASRYRRFLSHVAELSPAQLDQFTDVHYPDSMALVATVPSDGREKQIGVARYVRECGTDTADVAIVVADEWHGQGVGKELLCRVLKIAESACMEKAQSLVLRDNTPMLRLAARLGFALCEYPDDPVLLRISKRLRRNPVLP